MPERCRNVESKFRFNVCATAENGPAPALRSASFIKYDLTSRTVDRGLELANLSFEYKSVMRFFRGNLHGQRFFRAFGHLPGLGIDKYFAHMRAAAHQIAGHRLGSNGNGQHHKNGSNGSVSNVSFVCIHEISNGSGHCMRQFRKIKGKTERSASDCFKRSTSGMLDHAVGCLKSLRKSPTIIW